MRPRILGRCPGTAFPQIFSSIWLQTQPAGKRQQNRASSGEGKGGVARWRRTCAQRPDAERPAAARRWPMGLMAGARRGGAPPQPATPGCRQPAAGGRGQLRGLRRGSSAPSQRRGDAGEDTAARGGGRSAAPVLTIGGELGANGGAPPVVEHPRLDLQRQAPERLAEHVESERLGGAVAGEGRSAHWCRGTVVVRRKPRGCLARAPTRTPPSPWAPRPSAAMMRKAYCRCGMSMNAHMSMEVATHMLAGTTAA
eukprot:COSAG04_NODE_2997_length_3295_cov_1.976846_2_plen_254_part_00